MPDNCLPLSKSLEEVKTKDKNDTIWAFGELYRGIKSTKIVDIKNVCSTITANLSRLLFCGQVVQDKLHFLISVVNADHDDV